MNRQHGAETLRSTMKFRFRTLAVLACMLASGCVIVPVTIEGYDPDCRIVTRHMELQTVQMAAFNACNGQGCETLLLAAFGVTAVSAVVSGSIVAVGNVVFWAEHRADCPMPREVRDPPELAVPPAARPAASAATLTPTSTPPRTRFSPSRSPCASSGARGWSSTAR